MATSALQVTVPSSPSDDVNRLTSVLGVCQLSPANAQQQRLQSNRKRYRATSSSDSSTDEDYSSDRRENGDDEDADNASTKRRAVSGGARLARIEQKNRDDVEERLRGSSASDAAREEAQKAAAAIACAIGPIDQYEKDAADGGGGDDAGAGDNGKDEDGDDARKYPSNAELEGILSSRLGPRIPPSQASQVAGLQKAPGEEFTFEKWEPADTLSWTSEEAGRAVTSDTAECLTAHREFCFACRFHPTLNGELSPEDFRNLNEVAKNQMERWEPITVCQLVQRHYNVEIRHRPVGYSDPSNRFLEDNMYDRDWSLQSIYAHYYLTAHDDDQFGRVLKTLLTTAALHMAHKSLFERSDTTGAVKVVMPIYSKLEKMYANHMKMCAKNR